MIRKLSDGEFVKLRPFNYVSDWLNEKSNQKSMQYLDNRFGKPFIEDLTHSQFWELFHQACNEEMYGKF